MNSNHPTSSPTEQEIDLLKIGASISNWFQNISLRVFKILLFFKKNVLIIGVLLILGIALGWYADQRIKNYSNQIILSTNFGSTDYIYSKIELLNAKIKDRDTAFLINIGFVKPKNIGQFKVKPIVDVYEFIENKESNFQFLKLMAEDGDLKKIILDNITSKNYPYHMVTFETNKIFKSEEIVTPLFNFLNDSEHFKKMQKEHVNNLNIKLKANDSIIAQIDRLLNEFSKNSNNNKNSSLFFYNENNQLNDLLKTKNNLIYESGDLRLKLVNFDKIAKEASVFINIPNKSGFGLKLKLIVPFILILMFVFFKGFQKWTIKMKQQL